MTAPDPLNRTDPRASALAEVRDRKIFYGERSGTYFENVDGEMTALTGARRRTFAELRGYGVIEPTDTKSAEGRKLMAPTSEGLNLILDWQV